MEERGNTGGPVEDVHCCAEGTEGRGTKVGVEGEDCAEEAEEEDLVATC